MSTTPSAATGLSCNHVTFHRLHTSSALILIEYDMVKIYKGANCSFIHTAQLQSLVKQTAQFPDSVLIKELSIVS